MLSHEPAAMETSTAYTAASALAPQELLADSLEESLEEAVDQVCAPLIGTVPRSHRLAKRAALRAELNTLVAAHRELESSLEQAVVSAIAHFARQHPVSALNVSSLHVTPQAVTSQQTITRTKFGQATSARPTTLLAFCLLMPFYIAHIISETERVREAFPDLASPGVYRCELFLVPLLAGLIVGLTMRRNAVRGMLIACFLIAVYAVGIPSLFMAFDATNLLPSSLKFPAENNFLHWIVQNPIPGFFGVAAWPLCSAAGAALGARLRRNR